MSSAPALATSRLLGCVLATALLVIVGAGQAAAQPPVEPRQRPFRGLFGGGPPQDPNRTRQELTLTGSVFGVYDDNLVEAAPGFVAPPDQGTVSGTIAQGALRLRYYRGRPVRSFTIDGNAYVVDYGSAGVGITQGGSLNVTGHTRVRRSDSFLIGQQISYDPLFSLAPTASIDPVVDVDNLPQSDPADGVFELPSWSSTTTLAYNLAAGRRTSLLLSYDFESRQYEEVPLPDVSVGSDMTAHRTTVAALRNVSRTWGLRTQYTLDYARPIDIDGVRPVTDHMMDAGVTWERRVSRTRTLSFSGGAGAHYVRSTVGVGIRQPVDYWAPSGQAAFSFDLSQSWNLAGDYRRDVTVVPELTRETFLTDAVYLNARGLIGDRLEVLLSAGQDWSGAAEATGSSAAYRSTWAGVQAQLAITRMVALTATYTLFNYDFDDVSDLPAGFAPQSRRNAVRVGVTVLLSLLGQYVGPRTVGSSRTVQP